jgi:hypothetical protein
LSETAIRQTGSSPGAEPEGREVLEDVLEAAAAAAASKAAGKFAEDGPEQLLRIDVRLEPILLISSDRNLQVKLCRIFLN